MAINDYANALTQYQEAFDDREDPALIPILAEINTQIRDYRVAERWYKRLLRRDNENVYAEQRYDYGRVLKMQGKYPEAIEEFQTYLEVGGDETKKAMAQLEIQGAELALSMPGNLKGVAVEALDRRKVNTSTGDHSPALSPTGNVLYYTSSGSKDIIISDDENDPEQYFQIFQSTIDEDGYEKGEVLGPEINRPGYHSVNVSLSPDGRRMYFNRISLSGNEVSEAKIYMSEGGDGGWKSANEAVGVNGDFKALQPTVGELYGKEVLFFVSDMDGGEGGRDIYYATYQGDGVYADPVNLGPQINTPGDDETPFWFDGTLYFASDGYPSLGGLDIFYAVWNGTEWSTPANMGKAYNTAADEHYFRIYDEGYQGYFSSNRPEGRSIQGKTCCDDIYGFTIARQFVDLVAGTFTEDRKPLKGATMQLIDGSVAAGAEDTQSQTLQNGNAFSFGLDFEHAYTIIASHPDYYPDTLTFNTMGITDSKTIEQRLFLKAKPKEPIYTDFIIDKPIVMENILYDFDSDRITDQAEIDLQTIYEIMTEYPDITKVELGSHTDSRGDDNYNLDLSQRRAESARRWLMRKGIARDRIAAQGYGETSPKVVDTVLQRKYTYLNIGDILTEEFINALPTEEQQEQAHQENRRTEFTIKEGRTSIQIKTTRLKKQDENDRGSNIGTRTQHDPVKISNMSSLYGQSDLKGVPIMQFEERTKSLGTVKIGEKRSFSYTFTNEGDTDLIIDLVSACDCTSTNQDDLLGTRFKPGQSATLEVTFDSTDKTESETIDIDIFLRNEDKQGNPIVEMLRYDFVIE